MIKLFYLPVENFGIDKILEDIVKLWSGPTGFFHIVSINPENVILSRKNLEFRKVILSAQMHITDGIGTVLAAQILTGRHLTRLTGADLMGHLLTAAGKERLDVLLIGGRPNLAADLAKCYQRSYPKANFQGITGFANIIHPSESEEQMVFAIVASLKPRLILAAFGSPWQELWFAKNSKRFGNAVCMGVGGGFDYAGGLIPRAPRFMRQTGLEWLFRLIVQPRRLKRQISLVEFVFLVILEKIRRLRKKYYSETIGE
ncbi:WecB/TagA/CpsF family glycosyltransferase [Candidatus Roizmanbacteria bacterium]|nr:WecB/TagA/CpsF family glycosyltransferase [Candidatus Roizmanbacteria bacterium]